MYEQLYVEAVAEAKRFLKIAEELADECCLKGEVGNYGYFHSPKHTAALKRASMDLSRSLSKLRANKVW